MPVFQLSDDLVFPSPDLADDNGLLAVGGDLSKARLLLAYSKGIFPWYSEGDPILWWSPDPRMILVPAKFKCSRSLKQKIKKGGYHVTMDSAFESVIMHCASVHNKSDGATWITDEMMEAYIQLHKSGVAHSVETWFDDKLVGGLYGVSLGSAFFGESMFAEKSDASKVAFVFLIQQLQKWEFTLIDCQITTAHLKTFGAHEVSRHKFMTLLESALTVGSKKGKWNFDEKFLNLD
jgi:leucyl/phenylalanyl-tRNA--protein transferase